MENQCATAPTLLSLSDELLAIVLENAAQESESPCKHCQCQIAYNLPSIKTLNLVCHRFHNIVSRLPFRALQFAKAIPPNAELSHRHRQLTQNPSLGRLCRRLSFHIAELDESMSTDQIGRLAKEVLAMLPHVTCLECNIECERSRPAFNWALLWAAISNMPRIEHLQFVGVRGEGPQFDEEMMKACSSIPRLKLLSLQGVRRAFNLPSELHKTATFTALHLDDFRSTPGFTAQLLLWPKALECFEYASINKSVMGFRWELSFFGTILAPHKNSLRAIDIGHIHLTFDPAYYAPDRLFDVSDFPNLETLVLHRLHLDHHDSKTAAALLLAPQLTTFGYSFNIRDQVCERWDEFSERQENWLRGFATEAHARGSTLRKIEVKFSPDEWSEPGPEYPWDRMDRVGNDIVEMGIELVYNKPVYSRQVWLQKLDSKRIEQNFVEWKAF